MIHTHARRMLYFSDLYGPDYGPDFNAVVERHARLLDIARSGNPDDIARAVSDHIIEGGHKRVARIAAADVALRPSLAMKETVGR